MNKLNNTKTINYIYQQQIITQLCVYKPYCDIPIKNILITMYTKHTVNKITNLQRVISKHN